MTRVDSALMADERAGAVHLIVGGSAGIGRALALALARRGARVAVTARSPEPLATLKSGLEGLGCDCLVLTSDALDVEQSATTVRTVAEHFGRLDVVCLNVGGAPAMDLRVMTAPEVTAVMRANYDVAVNSLMPSLEVMSAQGSGTVVVINSLAGLLGVPLQGPYSAAKGALKLLIDTARLEYANRGISFVSVYPGFIDTERTRGDGMPKQASMTAEEAVAEILRALDKRTADHLFPFSTAIQVRLGSLAPARLRRLILRRRVAPDPTSGQRP